jgi:hypothetical protein
MSTTPTGEPATGVTSTSWWVTVAPMLAALAVALYPLITHQSAPITLGATISAGVVTIGAFVAKLWHDVQRRSLASGAADTAAILPRLETLANEIAALRPTPPPAP